MSAIKLYTQLSRKVMLLNKDSSDVFLSEFMKSDMGLLKLRTLLLCRSCRELCIEPFSSDFCQHLTCEDCLKQKKIRHTSCKWCRNSEDLVADFQSKILIASYKKLCAILRDFVTGYVSEKTGSSPTIKNKLMRFLNEGCSLPDITLHEIHKENIETEDIKPVTKISKAIQADILPESKTESQYVCPPCCCTCTTGDIKPQKSNPSDIKIQVVVPQSSAILNEKKSNDYSPDYRSDTVSSTVPDTVPVSSVTIPESNVQNKYVQVENDIVSSEENCVIKIEPGLNCETEPKNDIPREQPPVSSCEFYDALSSISLKERQNRSIFEKFGLALSPTPGKIENEPPVRIKNVEKHRRKLKKNKEKKKKHSYEINPKVQPLKLKVRKINSYNSDGYSVQYNITNGNENNEEDDNFVIHKANEENTDLINTLPGSPEPEVRKLKRKATFISNYAVFSDESDFESNFYLNKRNQKVGVKKDRPEACGCGSGSHVKYFTNICKRARCPCFSQGRPCVNCKCRFCSNPYLMENQVDEMFTDSDSANEQPQLTYWLKDETEVIDVESM